MAGGLSLGGTFEGKVLIDPQKLAEVMRSENGPVVRDLLEKGDVLKAGAQRRVGVDTGKLRDSIVKRIVDTGGIPEVWVGSEVHYAGWHHEGTEPHDIYPVNAKVLSFIWHGERVFFAHVRHPGTKPNRFLTDSIADIR